MTAAAARDYRTPLHVLLFTSVLGGGGAERNLIRIANSLDRERFRITICVARGGGSYEGDVSSDVTIRQLGVRRMWAAPRRLRALLKIEKPDVVCTFLDHASVAMLLAVRGVPARPSVVISVQNNLSRYRWTRGLKLGVRRLAIRAVFPLADHAIALSDGVRAELEELVPRLRGRTSMIPNAGFDAQVLPLSRKPGYEPPRPAAEQVIVACGRLVEQKGFHTLIRAFAKVRREVPAQLWLLGDGELRDELEAEAERLQVRDAIWFAGFQANPYRYMAAGEVFVLSSLWEGFGNVVVEAMATGTPVVATDCPYGPGEIIRTEEEGILVPPGDADSLAAALVRVLRDDALRQRLSAGGRRRAHDYEPVALAARYGEVFAEVHRRTLL